MSLQVMVTLPGAQGEQEEQHKESCREIAAASKGNAVPGQPASLRLAPCPSLPSRWAGAAQRCSFWSCAYGETCHAVNMELNLTPIYTSRAWQWPSSLCRCSGLRVPVERVPAARPSFCLPQAQQQQAPHLEFSAPSSSTGHIQEMNTGEKQCWVSKVETVW